MRNENPPAHHLGYFQYGRLEDAEKCSILGVLGPAHNLTPVLCISFFFSRSSKDLHIIFGDTAENEEETGEYTGIGRQSHVNGSCNLARREESVCYVLMLRKIMNMRTSNAQLAWSNQVREVKYLIKSVRAWTDIPSWSNTFIRWGIKSAKDMAKLFLGATNSFGSRSEGSGL